MLPFSNFPGEFSADYSFSELTSFPLSLVGFFLVIAEDGRRVKRQHLAALRHFAPCEEAETWEGDVPSGRKGVKTCRFLSTIVEKWDCPLEGVKMMIIKVFSTE